MKEKDFLDLINRHKGILHKICYSYSNTQEEYEDLMQEVLLQLWRSKERFKGQSSYSTWMYKVALFTALAQVKRKKPNVVSEIEDYQQKAESSNELTDELEVLNLAIKSLPEADRAVLILYLEEKSYREMSEILGLTESNIGVKLNRIKEKLRKLMISR